MKILNLIAIFCFFMACKERPDYNNTIVIEGQIQNMPDGKIYLTDACHREKSLYSTDIKDGHFIFTIKPDSPFIPFKAAIRFPDPSANNKVGSFLFRNHMQGTDSLQNFVELFYLEKGYTRIEGDQQQKPYLRVFAGKETDIMYKYQLIDFGFPRSADSAQRSAAIQYFKKLIQQYPYSRFLLQSIYSEKVNYSKNELQEILALFDTDVQQSKTGRKFANYLARRPDPGAPYPNLLLPDSSGQNHLIIDTTTKLNMLVFWASWCGPCRKEIPVLKQIHKAWKKKGVTIVSISIDKNKADWLRALQQTKMPWPQYIAEDDKKELIEEQFNFSSIPLIVFIDKNRKQVMRLSGYSKDEKEILDSAINKILVSK